ncbi:hypothetical protein BR63_05240 [Thermanaerosceptrum fracticalcis]|uniref:Flagellar hook-length control protein-like C-terminal domain-containing protein n=1 Tax=Thermanaerosceptrum fracticalcis TaxID=1712410 RepID=A0A7G6E114_THEFR|nr:hypothetical protein BR63_05240 [Thermanaerosceptrum fracticalcis]
MSDNKLWKGGENVLNVNNVLLGQLGQTVKIQENVQVETGGDFLGMLFSILSNGNMTANQDERKERLQEVNVQPDGATFIQPALLFHNPYLVEDVQMPGMNKGMDLLQGETAAFKGTEFQPAALGIFPEYPKALPVLTAQTIPPRQFPVTMKENPIPTQNPVPHLSGLDNSLLNPQLVQQLGINRMEVKKENEKGEALVFTAGQVENREVILVTRQAAVNTAKVSPELLKPLVPPVGKTEELQEATNQPELKGDNNLVWKDTTLTALPVDGAPPSEEIPQHPVKVPVQEFPKEFPKVVFSRLVSGGKNAASEVVIHLEPQDLGKMVVKLLSEEGVVSVRIIAEHPVTRDLLENGLQALRQSFSEQGLKPGRMEIELGGQSLSQQQFYQQHQQQQPSWNRGNYWAQNWLRADSGYLSESEQPGEPRMQMMSRGSVDYTV